MDMEFDIAPYGLLAAQDEKNKQQNRVRAWLLELGNDLRAAIPLHEMSQVLLSPDLYSIPLSPAHCQQVLLFQKRILPVIDVSTLVTDQKTADFSSKIIGLTVYQKAPKQPLQYAAMHLANMPTMIYVDDSQLTTLPEHEPLWKLFSVSCFMYEDRKIPVLDLAALYSAEVLEQVN